MDPIRKRIRGFKDAKKAMALGLYPFFRAIESEQDTVVQIDGNPMLMLGSNSYLGLTNDPRVKEAAERAVKRYGTGCAGSRFLNGTLSIHNELEERLARLVGKEEALVLSAGFMVNFGVISALVHREDAVLTDQLNHASIVDGVRMSHGHRVKFQHNDMGDLESKIGRLNGRAGKLIVVDGVFSMDGDIANLPEITRLAKTHDAMVMVDEAHSIGVMGPGGAGASAHFGVTDRVHLIMGTFSKSLAAVGGFIASDKETIHYLKHHCRPLIFSASPPPAVVGAVMTVLDIMETEPERIERLWENTRRMQDGLIAMGFDIGNSETPIIPVFVGDMFKTLRFGQKLHKNGVFVNPVVAPGVPPDKGIIRVSLMATHTNEQIDQALDAFHTIGRKMSLIP